MRKWTIRQFEWYRDNNRYYYRLNLKVWGGFFLSKMVWQTVIGERFSLLTTTENWQLGSVDNNNILYRKRRKRL